MKPGTWNLEPGTWNLERRKSLGLSLVELTMFIVIVGAAVAGIIGVIGVTTRSSADPVIHKQALAIAEAVLEEVQLQPFTYCDPDDPSAATADAAGVPIGFRAAAQAGAASGVLTLTINKPTGTLQNDVMVASIGIRPNTATVTPPAGWTLVRRINSTAGTSNSLVVYRKVAGASEPANYSWTFSTSTGSAGGILSFSDVDTATPIDVENGQPTPVATTHSTPSVTTTVPNAMLVASFTYSSPPAWTPPTGMTEVVDIAGGGQSTEINYLLQAAAGATGTKTATPTPGDNDAGNTHILALKPTTGCPVLTEAIGPEAGETRYSTTLPFDNVNDYHGFDSNTGALGIRNIDDTLIAGLEGYRVMVSVAGQALGPGTPISPTESLLITVTVTGPGNTTVTLNGYRTRYAPNDLP